MHRMPGCIAAILLLTGLAFAQNEKPIRPTDPLVIADFESPGAVDLWKGVNHSLTGKRASSGATSISSAAAMAFSVPKYEKGDEERPGVWLPFAGGKGFPTRDFSGYGKIVADICVDGEAPGKIGLKLVDAAGNSSWTTHVTLEPAHWTRVELLIDDAAADSDVGNVDAIVLYALRPEAACTFQVDNIRLEPRDKPPLATFSLLYPNYRGLIFPNGGDVEVEVELEAEEYGLKPGDTALELTLSGGDKTIVREKKIRKNSRSMSISPRRLPDGPAILTARLVGRRGGEELARRDWQIRKVSPEEQASLKVYIDRANNTVVDGKPFFPVGWYGNSREDYLEELADSPFNCLLAYATNHVPKAEMLKFLDTMQEKGLKLVYCMNDVYPTATYFDGNNWEGITGNDAIASAVVEAYKDHPAVLAWYLNDELPRKLVPDLTGYYERVKEADPNHPCFIVLCNRSELRYFPDTTDILGVDPYPVPKDPLTQVSLFTDAAHEAVNGAKPVWQVPQAFAWYQYKSDNKDRGHIPTPDELKTGRAPNYLESRCMTYLSLTHGAKGLLYYCYYDLRLLPQYNEMWEWMKSIGAEVKTLSPILLSKEDLGTARFTPETAPIHTKLKRHDGRLYLMAVNPSQEVCNVTFNLGHRLPGAVDVMFEDRQANTAGHKLSDTFQPLEVHVYDLGPSRR